MAYLINDKSTVTAISEQNRMHGQAYIVPDVLYPAVANVMVDGSTALSAVTVGPNGSTVTSSKYGTVQSDGRMYYYTDIKGSKPIKDPRIGAHFGSQRHKFKSLQILEQETAATGKEVRSIDGREWCRITGVWHEASGTEGLPNNARGQAIEWPSGTGGAGDFIEAVGYFSDANIIFYQDTNKKTFEAAIDGGSVQANDIGANHESILTGRYVDSGCVINITFNGGNPTLGIHTLKIIRTSSNPAGIFYGIELIAQDITSTATKSQIQIPSQRVVSFGKSFTIGDITPHYDPFNGFTNSSHLHSSYVDTATSLGLDTAPGSSASWAISSTNNIRPYNGGRVVRWIAEDGSIKTSVNMMPPNAQNHQDMASVEITTPSATNSAFKPAFSDDTIDQSQAEIARRFFWREFGNGAANQATLGANWADASMLNATDDGGYIMDDGCTGLTFEDCNNDVVDLFPESTDGDFWVFYFIGTGVVRTTKQHQVRSQTIAQNLPYGCHILRCQRPSSGTNSDLTVDGVAITTTADASYAEMNEVAVYQPKLPPIPANALIISDYMLMADFVPIASSGINFVSKGVRALSVSRDMYHDDNGSNTRYHYMNRQSSWGFNVQSSNIGSGEIYKAQCPSFCTNFVARGAKMDDRHKIYLGNTDKDASSTRDNTDANGSYLVYNDTETLGTHLFGTRCHDTGSTWSYLEAFEYHTPTHTSSHYQPFETPFLYELIGGDRNMEQTNLVVTPDGKTWDEVTRDMSYMGNASLSANSAGSPTTSGDSPNAFDEWRGLNVTAGHNYNKHFAIAYNQMICLYDGQYHITVHTQSQANQRGKIFINGVDTCQFHDTATSSAITNFHTITLKRGDLVSWNGIWNTNRDYQQFLIHKI